MTSDKRLIRKAQRNALRRAQKKRRHSNGNPMKLFWTIVFLLLLILLFALLGACTRKGAQTAATPGEEAQSEGVSFALDWTPNTNHTGLYVAQELGYFADAGLKVDIQMPQSSVRQLVASERIDFGIGFQEFSTSSIANEAIPIVSVAAVFQHNTSGFTAMKDRKISRPRDFAGKLYAGWGDSFELAMVRYLIGADGGDAAQFESITIGEAGLAGLLQDKVDYAWTYYAWQNIAFELQGLETDFIALRELEPVFDYYTPIIITSRTYLEQHKQRAARFIAALSRGYAYAAQNPERAAEILLSHAPELDRALVLRSQQYLAKFHLDAQGKWGTQNPATWDALSAWMYDNGLIDNPLPAEQAMTNELLP